MTPIAAPHPTEHRANRLRQSLQDHSRAAYQRAILGAAETIILRDGFKHTKMADIAEAIGISVGTLYNYFENRDAVLKAIIGYHAVRFQTLLEQPFDSDDPLLRLRQLITRVHGFVEENGELLREYLKSNADRLDPYNVSAWLSQDAYLEKVILRIEELLDQCTQSGRIRSDIRVPELTWSLRVMLQSLLMQWYRHPDGTSLQKRGDELVTLFFEGASTRGSL